MSTHAIEPAATRSAVPLSPNSWAPGGEPDPVSRRRDGLVGAPVSRVDGPLKVTGGARFAAEIPMEGMVYAALAHSTIAKGRLADLDTSAAETAPGVVLVMTHRNAPVMHPAPVFLASAKGAAGDSLPVMQTDRIHWNGQPIALVLAETQEQADHAASLVRARYEVQPAVTSFDEAKGHARAAPLYQGGSLDLEIGDAEAALAAAPHRIDATYHTPRHNQNAMELHAATLAWSGDQLLVHDCTQAVDFVVYSLAQIFAIDESRIRVTAPFVGGGFGGKTMWQHQILAVAAAKLAGRPVRVVLSREGVYRVVGGRTPTEQRVAIGAQADGRFDALIHTGTAAITPHNNLPEMLVQPAQHTYSAGSLKLGVQVADMDMLANSFMRAPGETVGGFALECAVDELADQLGMDPVEIRLRNEPETDPKSGRPFSSRHLVEAYRAGAERFGWERRAQQPGSCREGEWLVGMGTATATYPYYRIPGAAARITLARDGRATVEVAAHEMGMGTATVHAQVTADRLGLPIEQVSVAYGDSTYAGVVLAGGAQQTAAIGGAIIAAQRALVEELLKIVGTSSPLAGLAPDEVGGRDGGLCKLDEPERHESYTSILTHAERAEVTVEADGSSPEEMGHWSMHSFGAMFCEVRVNAITGETRVSRFLGSFDCGRILNPKLAASQFRGGIIMGLGVALMEETQFDERTGRIMNPSLGEYHVPVHMDVPAIDVMWTDIPDPHTPMGARGVGEIGATGTASAVANAIFNATGKRVRDLPITLEKLL